MKLGGYEINKYERGFQIKYGRVASHPYIPKKRYRILYPYFIAKSLRMVRRYEKSMIES